MDYTSAYKKKVYAARHFAGRTEDGATEVPPIHRLLAHGHLFSHALQGFATQRCKIG